MPESRDRYRVLEDEPASRLPVCLLVDRSYSMNVVSGGKRTGEKVTRDGKSYDVVTDHGGSRMDMLLKAVASFAADVGSDPRAMASVEMAIVSFGETITIARDFAPVDSTIKTFKITATDDGTRLGQGVRTALELLDRRKKDYRDYGIAYYQPQLVILTDGEASDPQVCEVVARDVQARMRSGKLICLPFLIGDVQGMASLQRFGPNGEIFRVDGIRLTALFQYLSRSAITLSRSQAGGSEAVTLEKMLQDLKKITTTVDKI